MNNRLRRYSKALGLSTRAICEGNSPCHRYGLLFGYALQEPPVQGLIPPQTVQVTLRWFGLGEAATPIVFHFLSFFFFFPSFRFAEILYHWTYFCDRLSSKAEWRGPDAVARPGAQSTRCSGWGSRVTFGVLTSVCAFGFRPSLSGQRPSGGEVGWKAGLTSFGQA